MTDYTELAKSLRICASEPSCEGCKNHVADEYYELFNSCTSGAETLMKEAADAIEELQAQLMYSNDAAKAIAEKVPKWIPVTERFPKEDETVLTWGKQGVVLLDWFHDNKWCCVGEVTHWMPLPEPPEEETE